MSTEAATIIGALICASVTILIWVLDKYQVVARLSTTKLNVTGKWHGWSVYVPIEGFFHKDREAIYRVEAELTQRGRRVWMSEVLKEILDIDGRALDGYPPREFEGKGEMVGDADITLAFAEKHGLTNGTMYLVLNTWGDELYGILAVRNPHIGKPVAVKVLLRRIEKAMPVIEDLGVGTIRALAQRSSVNAPDPGASRQ